MARGSTRAWILGCLLVAVALLPGCATPEPDGSSDQTYQVSGTFTENATQAQMDELGNHTRDRGGEIFYLESYPVQFRASNLTQEACSEVRSFAEDRTYVSDVGACEVPQRTSVDAQRAVSSG